MILAVGAGTTFEARTSVATIGNACDARIEVSLLRKGL